MATQPQQVVVQPQPQQGYVQPQPLAASYQVGQPYPQPQTVAMQPAPVAPGAIAYYPQQSGQVFFAPQNVAVPKYDYKPRDYFILSMVTAVICGIFSPISLVCSLTGLACSLRSQQSARNGDIKGARNNGLVAVYLNITAITSALVVACLATGLTLGLYYTGCNDYYYGSRYSYNCFGY